MEEIKKQIKALGVKQYELAKYLGMSQTHLNRLLNQQVEITEECDLRLRLALLVFERAQKAAAEAKEKVLKG